MKPCRILCFQYTLSTRQVRMPFSNPSLENCDNHDMSIANVQVSNGFVSNSKLLNVALTRSKSGLICIGNARILSEGSKDFFDLTENLASRGCLLQLRSFDACLDRTLGTRFRGPTAFSVRSAAGGGAAGGAPPRQGRPGDRLRVDPPWAQRQ